MTPASLSSGCRPSRPCKVTHLNVLKMKHELENTKPQQYPGQNIANMSLDVTYHCQALTTAGIWDHQLCLNILSTFLLADGDEMYCHSLITMKATLEDKLKKVRFMEHVAGTTHLCSKGLTYTDICDLAETQYKEAKGVVSGLLPHMPRTPRPCLPPSPKLKSIPLSLIPPCPFPFMILVFILEQHYCQHPRQKSHMCGKHALLTNQVVEQAVEERREAAVLVTLNERVHVVNYVVNYVLDKFIFCRIFGAYHL